MRTNLELTTAPDEVLTEDVAHLVHPLHDRRLTSAASIWERAEGCELIDADGRRYFDGMSGLHNVTLGHGRAELIEAATTQLKTIAYASPYSGGTTRPAVELARRLSEICYPSINRFFFTSGGGEATDTSVKLARAYHKLTGKPEKYKVISLMGSYHGTTLGSMAATGMPNYWPAFEPRMPGFIHIPGHDTFRYKPEPGKGPESAAEELEKAILAEGPETVAMFIIEPVMGAGAIVPPNGYMRRVREICSRYDVLLVADEVITGFGRTGRMFALDHWGIEPDMVQFAKGITSGYIQLGGVGMSDAIGEAVTSTEAGTFMHAYTYSGHPVACAVALAVLDVLEKDSLVANAAARGDELSSMLNVGLGQHPNVGTIRGLGLQIGLEFVKDRDAKTSFNSAVRFGPRVVEACHQAGLVIRGRGDSIYISPPLTSNDQHIAYVAKTVVEQVRRIAAEVAQ